MKIPKLFKKAAAFVMAAVTALSIMPATAFAAGDIGNGKLQVPYVCGRRECILYSAGSTAENRKHLEKGFL